MDHPIPTPFLRRLIVLAGFCLSCAAALGQGSLAPPGPPAPTMKTLQQIEPRTPIASLPFTISAAGSYYLTTNLTGASGTNGITITTGNVTLDLGGFTLAGGPGSNNGIEVSESCSNITIQNGTVSGWGNNGVAGDQLQNGRFNGLNLIANGGDGLDPGQSGLIDHCSAYRNLDNGFGGFCSSCVFAFCVANQNSSSGFSTFEKSSLHGCTASLNALDGVIPFVDCSFDDCNFSGNGGDGVDSPYPGCLAVHCVCNENGSRGLTLGDHGTVRDCVVFGSGSYGILVGNGCMIESCISSENQDVGLVTSNACSVLNCTTYSNSAAGISVSTNCQVKNCAAAFNTIGIGATNGCTISGCTTGNNATNGIYAGSSCFIENNTCQANGGGNPGDGGIRCPGSSNRIDGNHLTDNTGAGVYLDAGGNTVTRNSAKNNSLNYSVGSGNDVGPIGTAATSNSPWANLQ